MLRKVKHTGEPKEITLSSPSGTNQWTKVGTFNVTDSSIYNSMFVHYLNGVGNTVPLNGQSVVTYEDAGSNYNIRFEAKAVLTDTTVEVWVNNKGKGSGWSYGNGSAELY